MQYFVDRFRFRIHNVRYTGNGGGVSHLVVSLATTTFFGCSNNETIEANELVNRAHERTIESTRRDEQVDEEIDKLDGLLDSDPPNAQRLMRCASETVETLDLQSKSIKETIDQFKEAKRLNLSDTYKEYLDMEINASKTLHNVTLHMKAINEGFMGIAQRILEGKTTEAELELFDESNGDLIEEMQAIDQDYLELQNSARRFFIRQNLAR